MKEDRELVWLQCVEPVNSVSRITDNHMEWITYYYSSHSNQIFRRIRDEDDGIIWEVAHEEIRNPDRIIEDQQRNEIKIEALEKLAEEFRIRGMFDAEKRTFDRIKEIKTYGS